MLKANTIIILHLEDIRLHAILLNEDREGRIFWPDQKEGGCRQ